MKSILTALALVLATVSIAQTMTVKSDDVKVEFLADMQKTDGTIGGFDAKIKFDPSNLTASSIKGSVDVSTLSTGNKMRDKHLKSDDYFDAEKYPKITFESKSIEKTNDGFKMTGTVTMAGESHEETITFSYKDNTFVAKLDVSAAKYKLGSFGKKKPEKTMVHITMTIPAE